MWFLVFAHTITQSCITRAMFERGIYKKRGPGRRKFIDGGLFGVLNRAGAWTGAGAGVEKKNALPWAIDWGGGQAVSGPGGPVMNTTANEFQLMLLHSFFPLCSYRLGLDTQRIPAVLHLVGLYMLSNIQ